MIRVRTVDEVYAAIQKVKAAAPAFCTNFFPAKQKLQAWIEHGELTTGAGEGTAFFFRDDRDFQHFYFTGASVPALQREIVNLAVFKTHRVVTDLVGSEAVLGELLACLETSGFRRYSQLQRMARAAQPLAGNMPETGAPVVFANATDGTAVMELLENSFDHYADQLPTEYEIEAAIQAKQIFAIKCDGELAAILFFETQGFTSTVRYWVVGERFQSKRVGASLIRHYFATQGAVRRFVLWVTSDNNNAVNKYQHYGYKADGLIDHVLVNDMISR